MTSMLTEEQLTTVSPTAAAVSKIKPDMRLTEVNDSDFLCPDGLNIKLWKLV